MPDYQTAGEGKTTVYLARHVRRVRVPAGTDPDAAQLAVLNSLLAPSSSGAEVDLVRDVASRTPPQLVPKTRMPSIRYYSNFSRNIFVNTFRDREHHA